MYFYDGGNMETKIALIGTGGTIAGQGASDTDLTGYTAGVLGLNEILDSGFSQVSTKIS